MKNFHFRKNLKSKRLEKNLTQEYVALKLNIAQIKYSRLEKKSTIPELSFVYEIAEVLKVKPAELMPKMEEDEPNSLKKIIKDYWNGVAYTNFGVLIYLLAFYFSVDWAGVVSHGVCWGLHTSERTERIVSVVFELIVFFYMIYLGYRLWLKKWIG